LPITGHRFFIEVNSSMFIRYRSRIRGRGPLQAPTIFPALVLATLLAAPVLLSGCKKQGGATTPAAQPPAPTEPAPVAVEDPATPSGDQGVAATTPDESPTTVAADGPAATTGAPAGKTRPPKPGPVLTFEQTSHDWGEISDFKQVRTSFTFTNTGTEQLNIESAKGSCGCTVPTLRKREYVPGESGTIDVVFDPKGRSGQQPKKITVKSNSRVLPELVLNINALVVPMVKLPSKYIQLGIEKLGTEHRRTIKLNFTDPELVITDITSNQPYVTGHLVEAGSPDPTSEIINAYKAVIEIVIAEDAPWGTMTGVRASIHVRGRPKGELEPLETKYDIYVQGTLFGEIEASREFGGSRRSPTTRLSIGSIASGQPFEQSLRLTRTTGEPFTITEADVLDSTLPGVQVRTDQVDPATYDLVVFGTPTDFTGFVRGKVIVKTDLPAESELQIDFNGRVQEGGVAVGR
jgi:hypothetical protein